MAWQHRTVAQEWEVVGLSKSHPIKRIAELTGLGPYVVFSIQRKYHLVSSFGRQHAARHRYAYDEHAWGRVIETLYYGRNRSLEEVAASTGVHRDTIVRRMDDLGLPRKSASEARRGRKHSRRHRFDLPVCETDDCSTYVRTAGEKHCATCRRKPARAAA